MRASTRLNCPKCGWDAKRPGKLARWFTLFQFLVREHRVTGVSENGAVRVAREPHREDTGGALPMLRCGDCGHEFDLPSSGRVKYL